MPAAAHRRLLLFGNNPFPITDNFSGADGALIQNRKTNKGSKFWQTLTGAPVIQSNQAQITDALLDLFYVPSGTSNGLVSAKLSTLINSTGIAARVQDANNYLFARVNAAGSCSFFEMVAGVPTSKGSSASTWVAGDVLGMDFRLSVINIYRNGVLDFTPAANSNFLTATWHGLRGQGAGTAWDNFSISK